MQRKGLAAPIEVKAGDKGEISAVFATFNVVDLDGDVTLSGAFEDGAEVAISDYGHTIWSGSRPVGKGVIRTTEAEAIFDGQFFMEVPSARDMFLTLKAMGRRQQWSYGFDTLDAEPGTFDGRDVRLLKRQLVHEVSPVPVGAGIGTRTLATKSAPASTAAAVPARGGNPAVDAYRAAIRPHVTPWTVKSWDAVAAVAGFGAGVSVSDLRTVYAWVDPDGDPERKSSYGFPHHHGVNGDANLRACRIGIALLNGAAGAKSTIPDADRRGVYNHLASHLDSADRDVPELRERPGGSLQFHEQAAGALAVVSGLLDRTAEVVALRTAKGRKGRLASESLDLLEWVLDDMRRLRALIDTPQDDFAREFARFVQSQQPGEASA